MTLHYWSKQQIMVKLDDTVMSIVDRKRGYFGDSQSWEFTEAKADQKGS